MSRATSNESQIGPGSYYYFDSNTLPRAQAKKYDFPWDSLPKDWTTSVKLREISKRRKEDRQSSSGNWSQSGYSSNRQSLDSDVKSSMPSSTSQCSLGKDSGRDSPRSAGERDVLDTGYMGDATSTESVSDTKSVSNTDSDDWIRSLAERAAGRGDVTSTSAEALANLSRLTKQNIRNLDILVPGRMTIRKKRNELEDDGESSVYSLDQEGFYTSFHNDSGLRKSSTTLLDEEDDDLIMPRVRESKSLQSVASYSTVESVIFRPSEKDRDDYPSSQSSISSPNLASLAVNDPFLMAFGDSDIQDIDASEDQEGEVEYGDTGTLKAKKSKKGKKPPPPPPPRRSSTIRSQTNRLSSDGKNNPDDSPNSNETSSESSDHETVYARLKMKTSISAHAFPSWCPGNISDEDDFQERLNAESSEVEELCSAGKDNWLSGTLPRSSIVTESSDTHSWPRVKRSNIQQPGILKTPEKDKVRPVSGNPKILNFDPVVNLFDAQSPHGVQLPLSRLSSSDESGSPPSTTTTFDSHPLSHQMSTPIHNSLPGSFATESSKVAPSIDTPSKHQSVLYEMPGSKPTRPRSMVLNQKELQTSSSTPIHSYHVTTPTSANGQFGHSNKDPSSRYLSSDLSAIHSVSNPSLASIDSFDAPPGAALSSFDKSKDTLGSNSTIALSDIDSSSFTHVSLTDSTPSGSTLSLNWDTDDTPNPTPMATPKHKRAPQNLPPSAKRTDNSTNERHSSSATDSMPNNAGNFSKTSVSNVPSASNPSELSVLPSTPFSSSSSSSSHQRNPLNGSQPQSSSSSSYHSGIHQPESGTVITAPNLSLGPSIMNKPSATPGHIISMQANDLSTNTGAPAANTNENISDSNNNKSKPSSFTILDSAMSKSSSWTGNQKMLDQNGSQSNAYPLHPPLNHSQSWSNAPLSTGYHQQPPVGFASRSTQKERRRSSPVMNRATYYSSSSAHSGNEDSSGSGHASSGSDTVKRRRSGNDLSSPADSGFGSPSVFNQPSMTVQQFSYSPSATQNQNPFPVAQNQSKPSLSTPHIKKAMLPDPKTTFSDYVPKLGSGYGNSFQKSDFPVKALGSNSSHSSESLNSQLSSSSAQQLIPSKHKTDLSHPVLQRGNSSESVHSNSSAGRSDSYRVAMLADSDEVSLIPNKKININSNNGNISTHRRGSNPTEKGPSVPRTILTKSLSTPAPAACSDDGISRADSYRCAVRNTQSMVLGELMGRNSSYRLATNDEDVVITDNRMDACNLWTGSTGGTRDMRRMGITDIDQLKHYNNEPDTNGRGGNKRNSKQGDTLHAKKKLGIKGDTEGLINPVKTAAQDHKRFTKPNSKDKNKHKTQSSTYIRFDPIFESGEDLRASSESLRPPSIVSIRTLAKAESNETITSENAHLIGQKMGPTSPPRRRSASQGRRSTEDKSSRSILGSIKTSIKSIGGGKGE